MRTALALKQQEMSPLPGPIRQRATGHNPILLRSKQDQNQPPIKKAERTASIAGPTLLKHRVPSITTRHSRQSQVRQLANGIAKFPVWGILRNKATGPNQLQGLPKDEQKCSNCKQRPVGNAWKNCGFDDWCSDCDASLWATNHPDDGHTIQINTQANSHIGQLQADDPNQHNVNSKPTVDAPQSDTGGFQLFLDREAAHGSSTSSGSTGHSDGSLSDNFEDKSDPNFTMWEVKMLMQAFPVTFPSTLL
jgi:hypothetical protein